MRIGIDVDGVVADLHTPWLDAYNEAYNDRLTPADLTEWDFSKFTKPECGKDIYRFLVPEMYDDGRVRLLPGALHAVQLLRDRGHDIAFVTSCHTEEHADAKYSWLVRHGFLRKEGDLDAFVPTRDKSLVPVDVLVDDCHDNCISFRGRYACLITAPYNRLLPWLGMRAKSLLDFAIRTPTAAFCTSKPAEIA